MPTSNITILKCQLNQPYQPAFAINTTPISHLKTTKLIILLLPLPLLNKLKWISLQLQSFPNNALIELLNVFPTLLFLNNNKNYNLLYKSNPSTSIQIQPQLQFFLILNTTIHVIYAKLKTSHVFLFKDKKLGMHQTTPKL